MWGMTMYDYIIGQIKRITPEYVVVEQQGIGWQIFTPNPFAFRIKEDMQQIFYICMLEKMPICYSDFARWMNGSYLENLFKYQE